MATTTFADLGVPKDLAAVLSRQGIVEPFPIQAATIPDALAGRDVLGRAPTGSGKTLAFGIPMIATLGEAKPRHPRGLILSPTRELADQIRRELEPLAKERGRVILAVYGGVGVGKQINALNQGVDLLVACPGRLLDLIEQNHVSLEAVKHVVVDEADRMADMGFLPDVKRLVDRTKAREQTVFFSATLGKEVQVLTDRYQNKPVTHQVGEVEPDLSLVSHRFIRTEKHGKISLAAHLISEAGPTIVFCRTRYGVDRVARQLKGAGIKTAHIHGDRSQNQRDNALRAFTEGKVQALVATDVAARGIHVDGVACVVHFDPPEDDKAYVHRSGRTARAGARGSVITFVSKEKVKDIAKLQRAVGINEPTEDPPTIDTAAQEAAGTKLRGSSPNTGGDGGGGRNRNRRSGGGRSGGGGGSKSKSSNSKGKPSKSSKKKHQKKVAQAASRKRTRSSQKQHSANQSGRSGSNTRGRS